MRVEWMTMRHPGDVALADLRLDEMLDRGGQGEVWSLAGDPDRVLKKYLNSRIDETALSTLVDFPQRLPAAERDLLTQRTAWPAARVVDNGHAVGFLMRRVPPPFIGTTAGPKAQLRELQYLLYEPKPFWGEISPLSTERRVVFVRHFVEVVCLLHRRAMVLGDISMRNILFSDEDSPRVFVLDCDSARPQRGQPVLPQADTPDWGDPMRSGSDQDIDTDRYKLALVVGRVLASDAYVRPGDALSLLPDLDGNVAQQVAEKFQQASGARGSRPDAEMWVRALSGRGMIQLTRPVPLAPLPTLPMVDLQGRGEREMIQMRPLKGLP